MDLIPDRRHARVAEGIVEQVSEQSIEEALELDLDGVPCKPWPPRLDSTDDPDLAIRKLVRHFRAERNRQQRELRAKFARPLRAEV